MNTAWAATVACTVTVGTAAVASAEAAVCAAFLERQERVLDPAQPQRLCSRVQQAGGDQLRHVASLHRSVRDALSRGVLDLDRERANFADNTVRYEATLRFINSSMRTLNTAITGQ